MADKLLCPDCEQGLSTNGEAWTIGNMARQAATSSLHRQQSVVQFFVGVSFCVTWLANLANRNLQTII